jgi:hypothetical protein
MPSDGSLLHADSQTAWGKAQARALDVVVGVIERVGARDVKTAVVQSEITLPAAAKDALQDSVAKADKKKSPVTVAWKIIRELIRL